MLTTEDLKVIDMFSFIYNCPKKEQKEEVRLFYGFKEDKHGAGYPESTHVQYKGRLFDVRLQSIINNRGLPKSWLNEYAHYFIGEIDKELVRLNISRNDFITKNYGKEVIFNFDVKPFL